MGIGARAAIAAAALGLSLGAAEAQDTEAWRMTTVVPEVTTIYQEFSVAFAAKVAELTEGRITITPYPVGVIAPAPQVFDAVTDGLVELGHAPLPLLSNAHPETALFSSFPGGLGSEALMHWMYRGGGQPLLVEYMETVLGLHPLVVGFSTTELFAHSHVRLEKLEDFQGVKFRALGIFAEILTGLGATPVSTPTPEVVPALQQRVIDAAEFFPPSDNLAMGLPDIAQYVIAPGAHLPGGYFVVYMTADRWNALPDDLKVQLERAAELVSFESYLTIGQRDIEAMATMAANPNVEFVRLDPSVIEAIRKAGRDWAARVGAEQAAAGNDWVNRVAAAVFAYQDLWDANAWYRL